jgi:hypothetical protein
VCCPPFPFLFPRAEVYQNCQYQWPLVSRFDQAIWLLEVLALLGYGE